MKNQSYVSFATRVAAVALLFSLSFALGCSGSGDGSSLSAATRAGLGTGVGGAGRGPSPVALGAAGNYRILAESAVTNVPTSAVTGNVGLSPAAGSFIGIPCGEVTGTIY